MFYMNKETVLDKALLSKLVSKFQTNDLPKLKKWGNYYDGLHSILNKAYTDETKSCAHITCNYAKVITDTYAGYIAGKPISYSSNDNIEDVQQIINYNDSAYEDIEWLTNALIYGVAYELQWIDEFSQPRFGQVSPLNAFPVYSNSMDKELLYFVRWYKEDNFNEDNSYILETYDKGGIQTYKMNGLGGALTLLEEKPHYFGDIPVSVFWLNSHEENIFNQVISLIDAYEDLQSGEIDSFNQWVDAYLALTNVDADADDLLAMKENRTLILPEGATAQFLTKSVSDTQIENILNNLKRNIFKITSCVDMTDENFLAQSGTALSYKLVGFENVSAGIVAKMTKAIQRRIELICNILNLKATDAVWRDINIQFTRNLPNNTTELMQMVNGLQGMVSNETLISLLDFVKDPKAEIERLNAEKQNNMQLFSFGNDVTNEEEDDEDEQEVLA